MDPNHAALPIHRMLAGMSDKPMQFAESLFAALHRQCWEARYGHAEGLDFLDVSSVPF